MMKPLRPSPSPVSPALALGMKAVAGYPTNAFVTTWQTTTPSESITLPLYNTGTYNAEVDWGDGSTSTITAYDDADRVHEYATAGTHTIVITGTLPGWSFNNGGDKLKIRTVEQWGNVGFQYLSNGFYGCSNLESVAGDFTWPSAAGAGYAFYNCSSLLSWPSTIDLSGVTSCVATWGNCSSLTSFPAIDLSAVASLQNAWYGCSGLTSFGAVSLRQAGVSLQTAWRDCSSLTSFPLLTLGVVTRMDSAWQGCSGLTSFPEIDLSGLTGQSNSAWNGCSGLTSFPALDLSGSTYMSSSWSGCSGLTSFPSGLTLPAVARVYSECWQNCTGLTSFPALAIVASNANAMFTGCTNLATIDSSNWDTSACTVFTSMFSGCTDLSSLPSVSDLDTTANTGAFSYFALSCQTITTFPSYDLSASTGFGDFCRNAYALSSFPANMFDSVTATNYTRAFDNAALTETSVDNILVSLDTSGVTNSSIDLSTGTCEPPSATGLAAKTSLEGKGWTVTVAS